MKELPNIVRERLKATAAADHPDADLLTSFAEQALGERERARVMQHLGACADCREVLSLATAGSDSVTALAVPAKPAKKSWLSLPVLRWGTAGALVVVVGAAVMLRDQHKYASPTPAGMAVQSAEKRTEDALAGNAEPTTISNLPSVPPSSNALTLEARKLREASPKPSGRRDAQTDSPALIPPSTLAANGKPSPALIGGKTSWKEKDQAGDFTEYSRVAATPAAPSDLRSKKSFEFERKQTTGEAGYGIRSADSATASSAGVASSSKFDELSPGKAKEELPKSAENAKVGAAKSSAWVASAPVPAPAPAQDSPSINGRNETVGSVSETVEVSAAAPVVETSTSTRASLAKARINLRAPRWAISAEGELERSLDSGKNWEKISVSSGVVFRAVSAIGGDLWVGGANGALYHSSDSGQHFVQVNPSADGVTLTADISTIDFADLQHGKIGTTTNETWATSDAGQTWQKH